MKFLIVFVLAGVCILSNFAAAVQLHQDVKIPFQLVNKTIFVQVSVAHSKPLWFVLDTGDKYAVIDLSIAKSLGLELGEQVPVGGGGKDTVMGSFVKSGQFNVLGLEGFTQPLFIAVPLDGLAKMSGHEFAGILGGDFISEFVVSIDYPTQTITLHDKSNYQYRGDGESLPITFNAAGHPEVRAQVVDDSGAPINGTFVVDIGSGAALILNSPFVERARFLGKGRSTVRWIEGQGLGGGIDGSVGRIRAFNIGKYAIQNPVTVFSRANNGPFAAVDFEGNIGAAILEKFKVILDYSRNRIILEPNSQFSNPLEYNRSGLFLVSSADYKTYKIEAVADGSPAAEAGLHVGDIVTAVNGHPAADQTLSQLRSMFQDTSECDLTVERGREHLQVRLTLRRRI